MNRETCMRLPFDLIDILIIRNPESKRFTWKQNNPLIQRRLDFWLTSSNLLKSRLSLIVRVNVVLNRTVVVDSA